MNVGLLRVKSEEAGERLDIVLARAFPRYSRSFLQRVIKEGGVRRDGAALCVPSARLRSGDVLEIEEFDRAAAALTSAPVTAASAPAPGAPRILFEDEALLVIDKPAGLVVHPAAGYRGGTLIDWLRSYLGAPAVRTFTDPQRLGLVHRLDKDTSGLLLIAKTVIAQTALSAQFRDRSIQKTYAAFVEGILSSAQGIISAPVARSRKNPARMAVSNYGRPSETSFEVEEVFQEVTQVKLHPKTGRTHQIRVHMAAIGHPIVGDLTYGSKPLWRERFGVRRPLLHAESLEFTHPATEKKARFKAPWPADFLDARRRFRAGLKAALVAALVLGIWSGRANCAENSDDSAPAEAAPATPKKVVHHTASSSASSSAYRTLRRQVAALEQKLNSQRQSLDAMQQQVTNIQQTMQDLNAEQRFRDLDHAMAELNGKAVTSATTAEETKTDVQDISRRVKDQQQALDQMRDQLGRLARAVIQQRTQADEAAPAAPAPATSNQGQAER